MFTSKIKNSLQNVVIGDHQKKGFCLQSLLSILSVVYGGVATLRRRIYQRGILRPKRLPCTVVSIGNLTMGGTGKTPMTIYLARQIKTWGYRVAIVSRGYKGRAEKRGGVVSDGRSIRMSSLDAGDEPFMMASRLRGIPVVVGRNRFEAGMLAVKHFAPDVLVLDDAFQHVKLKRDVDLVLLDYRRPLGNGFLLPRGVLREPATSLLQADALILTRFDVGDDCGKDVILAELETFTGKKPIFRSSHVPYIKKVLEAKQPSMENNSEQALAFASNFLQKRRVVAFSGIANHMNFIETVENLGAVVADFQWFPDHYRYKNVDVKQIAQAAIDAGADCLVTTRKDHVRMASLPSWPLDLVVLDVEISFGDEEDAFNAFIKKRLEKNNQFSRAKTNSGE